MKGFDEEVEEEEDIKEEVGDEIYIEGDVDIEDKIEVFRHNGGIAELVTNLCEGKVKVYADVPSVYSLNISNGMFYVPLLEQFTRRCSSNKF